MNPRKPLAALLATATMASLAVGASSTAIAQYTEGNGPQTLNVDYGTETGDFYGGASGTLYGLGDNGSPTDAILNGASVDNTSQKPPFGTQHASGDALAVEDSFFNNNGKELAIYIQDYYSDWGYNKGKRPGDNRSYKLDVPVDDPSYGTYTNESNGRWDYDEITELVMNKVLANAKNPDQWTFLPFNEPDQGNWYNTGDSVFTNNQESKGYNSTFLQLLKDWDSEYDTINKVWLQYKNNTTVSYKNGEEVTEGTEGSTTVTKSLPEGVSIDRDKARLAGPGDSAWRPQRTWHFLRWANGQYGDKYANVSDNQKRDDVTRNRLPDVMVWHELGEDSLKSYRGHYNTFVAQEDNLNIPHLGVNITEYGEMRDMGTPGQLIQWMSMFEETKVQAETAYWNMSGNLSDNMSGTNSANAGWWMFKWYGDLRGSQTVKVTSPYENTVDNLQGIAAIDKTNKKATVLYGGANSQISGGNLSRSGNNIPVTVHMTGLDKVKDVLGTNVDVEVRENAYTGIDGAATTPRVVNVISNADISSGTLDMTTTSIDRYAGYQLVVTPHQDRTLATDTVDADGKAPESGRWATTVEAEDTELSNTSIADVKPNQGGWGHLIASGNRWVGGGNDSNAERSATWTVDVPADGDYRLEVIGGNEGVAGTNQISVDGKGIGDMTITGEQSIPSDAMKWRYQGSGVLTLKDLKAGKHTIKVATTSSKFNNTWDKFMLYQMGAANDDAITYYPSRDFRFQNGATLDWSDGDRGTASLNGGIADVHASTWESGYYDVTVEYTADKASPLSLTANGTVVANVQSAQGGLQKVVVRTALPEGITHFQIAGNGAKVVSLTTQRATESDKNAVTIEAEDVANGATVVSPTGFTNGTGTYVTDLGVKKLDASHSKVQSGLHWLETDADGNALLADSSGKLTIPAGKLAAGTYNAVVTFSNDINFSYTRDKQNVDLGLQMKQNGKEIARDMYRFTFNAQSFLDRSTTVTTNGGAIEIGNFDNSASMGVAPNIDKITFYPVVAADVQNMPVSDVESVAISGDGITDNMLTVKEGTSTKLSATVEPKTVSQDVTWTSSDPEYVTVDANGTLHALKSGKDAIITAAANADDRFAAHITVKVTAKESAPVDKSKLQAAVDEASKLNERDYSADSWKAFAGELESAKKVLADTNANQADVDAAAKTLADAKSKLDKTGDGNGSGNNGSNGNGSGNTANGSDSAKGSQFMLDNTGAGVAVIAGVAVLLAAGGLIIARRRMMMR